MRTETNLITGVVTEHPDAPVTQQTTEEKMATIRQRRNILLSDTDWVALSDVTMSGEMATYRQALRDLPATMDIDNPVYPTKPQENN